VLTFSRVSHPGSPRSRVNAQRTLDAEAITPVVALKDMTTMTEDMAAEHEFRWTMLREHDERDDHAEETQNVKYK
jgi:hypothetical protein